MTKSAWLMARSTILAAVPSRSTVTKAAAAAAASICSMMFSSSASDSTWKFTEISAFCAHVLIG